MRFRRSIKLAPGFRLNFSGSGLSASVGPRGASMTFGKRGTYFNAGIPGTGLSSRQRIGGASRPQPSPATTNRVTVSAVVSVTDEGEVVYRDADGTPLSDFWVDKAKRQSGPAIRAMIEGACEKINAAGKQAAEIHLSTPDPRARPRHEAAEFDEPAPREPRPKPHGILGRLFRRVAARIDQENAWNRSAYEENLEKWKGEREEFRIAQDRRKQLLEREILTDAGAMSAYLEERLESLEWPRETAVDFEIRDAGAKVMVDVDLPEIEDMPKRTATLPARGYKITMKDISAAQIQKQYMAHVHGVGFRIVGEVFASLPTAELVVLSAYSQRPSKATGEVGDEFLYSVRVTRATWQEIDFRHLEALDVVQALGRFDLRREMTKSGVFKPIDPFVE